MKTQSMAGFTLLEHLIVIVFLSILIAIGLPAWFSFLTTQRLNAAQDRVFWALKAAQSNAQRDRITWQVSFRETSVVEYAVHPATATPASWQKLDRTVQLDPETSIATVRGVRRVQFNWITNTNGQLGRVTLSNRRNRKIKRCVIVSTLIGNLRTAKQRSRPDAQGRFCY